jgi:hypothetical protein
VACTDTVSLYTGLDLQILWGDTRGCRSQCCPQWPKDQLALQPCAQAPWASWSHICWQKVPWPAWQGYQEPQEQAIKESHLEAQPNCLPSPLPLNLCYWIIFASCRLIK